jgi:hypothetical protein
MAYIVEVQDEAGRTARKEYEGVVLGDVLDAVVADLSPYPALHLTDIWNKAAGVEPPLPLPGHQPVCVLWGLP